MAEEATAPDVTASSVDPGAGDAPAPNAPTGSEADTNSGKQQEQQVPLDRFLEVNRAAKAAEERTVKLEEEMQALKEAQKASSQNNEDEDIDPDVQKILDNYVKKNGFVTKAELDAVRSESETQVQVQTDIAELKSQYSDYNHQAIIDYAKENQMPITSKKALEAAYTLMNRDSILENARKSAIAEFQESGKSYGEKPGSGGAKAPAEDKPTSIRDRVRIASQKLR